MRVYLKDAELKTPAGAALLELCLRVSADGKLDIAEIREIRRWLHENAVHHQMAAVKYLSDIMERIAADGVIDRDELLELHLAIERVIPKAHREQGQRARKAQERLSHVRDSSPRFSEAPSEGPRDPARQKSNEPAIYRVFKVRGVSFPNDDGSERQEIIQRCRLGEHLVMRRDRGNGFSRNAIGVFREGGDQLGNVPEYVARDFAPLMDSGMESTAILLNITGGTRDKPTCGVNVVMFVYSGSVPQAALDDFARGVLQKCAPHLRVRRSGETGVDQERPGLIRRLLTILGLRART